MESSASRRPVASPYGVEPAVFFGFLGFFKTRSPSSPSSSRLVVSGGESSAGGLGSEWTTGPATVSGVDGVAGDGWGTGGTGGCAGRGGVCAGAGWLFVPDSCAGVE
jgi:hypothetical protein